MAMLIPAHVCNYYCSHGQHAVPCISTAFLSSEEACKDLAVAALKFGWVPLSFKLAEADAKTFGEANGVYVDYTVYTLPYLAIMQPIDGVDPYDNS